VESNAAQNVRQADCGGVRQHRYGVGAARPAAATPQLERSSVTTDRAASSFRHAVSAAMKGGWGERPLASSMRAHSLRSERNLGRRQELSASGGRDGNKSCATRPRGADAARSSARRYASATPPRRRVHRSGASRIVDGAAARTRTVPCKALPGECADQAQRPCAMFVPDGEWTRSRLMPSGSTETHIRRRERRAAFSSAQRQGGRDEVGPPVHCSRARAGVRAASLGASARAQLAVLDSRNP